MLGLYVSDHPLMGAEAALRRRTDCAIADLAEREDGALLTVGGVVTNLPRKYTKKGDPMAVFVLEDLQDSIEVMVFPRVMLEHGPQARPTTPSSTVRGPHRHRATTTPKLIASEITIVEGLAENAPPLRLRLPAHSLDETRIDQLKWILREHPGDSPVYLHIGANGAGKTTTMRAMCGMIRSRARSSSTAHSILGKSPSRSRDLGVAHVPQGRGTFTELTVRRTCDSACTPARERRLRRRHRAVVRRRSPAWRSGATQTAGSTAAVSSRCSRSPAR